MLLQSPRKTTKHYKTVVKNPNSFLPDNVIHCKKYFPHVFLHGTKKWIKKRICLMDNQSGDYLNDLEQK